MTADAAPAHQTGRGRTRCVLCGGGERSPRFAKQGWTFVECACGLLSLDPLPTAAALAAHHEASYRDGGYADFAAAAAVRDTIARARLERLRPLASSGRWLDVGCSTGAFVAAATAAGVAAEGLEVSATAVDAARARGLAVHHGTVDEFVPAARFAVVTAFDVIEHLPDPLAFVRRVRAWLEPHGLLALTLPNMASIAARAMGRRWFYYAAPDHVHYFTPSTIRRLLEAAGFASIAVHGATKPLTLEYATEQLERLAPGLAPAARALEWVMPGPLRRRPVPLPIGEMLVTAHGPAA
jgi:2-polyprenyl-3-methyl-5-hydroxy-6-metoxy-1,4-benzoquinol methylase